MLLYIELSGYLRGILMKKLVLIIFLVGFSRVFPAFEVDVLGQLAASFGLPIAQSVYTANGTNFYSTQQANTARLRVKGSTEARLSGSVQIDRGARQRCRCSPVVVALFKSAVLPVPLKRNCRIKQKRQLSKAVFFVVQ